MFTEKAFLVHFLSFGAPLRATLGPFYEQIKEFEALNTPQYGKPNYLSACTHQRGYMWQQFWEMLSVSLAHKNIAPLTPLNVEVKSIWTAKWDLLLCLLFECWSTNWDEAWMGYSRARRPPHHSTLPHYVWPILDICILCWQIYTQFESILLFPVH